MNLFNIINEIEKIDPEFNDRLNPRRAAIKNITRFGSKVTLAAMPFALGTMLKRAYAADTAAPGVIDVLNFALTLEYLESSFYNLATGNTTIIPADTLPYFITIRDDENRHVSFLQSAISTLGGTPITSPNFDFSGGSGSMTGPFTDVFTNYDTFLKLALTFEDTGVRAYNGQASNLINNKDILTYVLAIHAVEARHASAIRQIFKISPWITSTATLGNDTGISFADANYQGEENVLQKGIDVTKLPALSGSTTSIGTATAAFDEPLTMNQVQNLIKIFIAP
ncbi:MAG: ferritin-like domain-containing protein [Mucilaginibacter sp.]|uniref:ferritin-like domain-containing protein n=1 Tax=Mucilaginibacter sp. TaxID=1882438 RepID=UPI0031B2CA4B